MKLLDCTLRDGGYYTNWDFSSEIVNTYINAMNKLPIDYIELGYRNNPTLEYLGEFGYSPASVLAEIRKNCKKKLALMLNEKSTKSEDLTFLLGPIVGVVDMIRIAIDPKNFDRAVILAKTVKTMGFEVGFNCMYMSKWQTEYPDFLSKLGVLDSFADLFCMVDSFGGVTPDDVTNIVKIVRENTKCPIGFHGHNNLQLGLINTITALKLGVEYVDATILGMGRGAGNLNMELLLTYLNSRENIDVDFNVLGDVITAFSPLMEKHHWGTNLPYMLAGANCIPQKEVMDWVTNRVYSFNSIVRALDNRRNNTVDNAQYPIFDVPRKFNKVLVVGGGETAIIHAKAIKEYIEREKDISVIFATARHANLFQDEDIPMYYILVGNEGRRLTSNVGAEKFRGVCVLPPYPRTMGTEVPAFAEKQTVELPSIDFIEKYVDSVTTVALQLADMLSDSVYVVGYDGYSGGILSEKEVALSDENKEIFRSFIKVTNKRLKSLTPSLYSDLEVESVYKFL